MKLSALKRCVMGSVRWAFQCGSWCPSQAEWLLCARCVQPEEKQRIGHFMFTRDAKAAMAGRLLMRKVIADKLQIPWDRILLERTGKGKPFLTGGSSSEYPCFNFNVSHQGDYAVLAAEPDRQVGVDIMKTDLPGSSSIEEFFRLMNRQFTEKEWNSIRSMNNDWARLDMFYRHWALKESFIKAIGVGLGFNLQRIEFEVSPVTMEIGKIYKETKMFLDDEEETWTFEEILLDNQHHVAIALGEVDHLQHQSPKIGDVAESTFTLLNFEDLMVSAIPMSDEDPDYWINFQSKQELPFRQRRSR
ncbi:L-aminoadipate-semialdehyde dehydrogenase-phosphopantetheinyl transferase [Xenopus laevis]|uniref:L-aminoadipate-semialdehyde dehydrogenase-phosphopantetheinyl transferase n=1 Tax=Xenopus laevis TaxID=8355 RepID=ADPPT_XENLA|nr:L-aminoadipate-semialdehyde dehydrogenase-phosphopantetheinyl transferase [Xenopus laevis]Q6DJH2.1 RecName: Full=L-aminoadipate-semialdehyde dehydrogenase-phosphopantetheinyl transferase; AltName: Full=4'-phosphopantetheinyl transferase; AltName: Full=Alpha-aminoadipic semialdehyde dehydrogenase-phosphopantetheinyl transferase; Short=AASD-PPT [Xenopus laevis]AAH75207.1 MGC84206 protein [Xenopus laevis]